MPTISVDMATARYKPYGTIIKPTFTSDVSVTWTTPVGSVLPVNGISTTLTFPNQTRVINVTGTVGGVSGSKSVQIYSTIPFQPQFGYELDLDNNTLRSAAEDGGAVFRLKGPIKNSWQVSFNNLDVNEWPILREFFKWHQKHIPFYYEDLAVTDNTGSGEANILLLVTFDAALKITVAGAERLNVATAFRQV